jgi:anaerobic selenocysteine-containing dehydrogenase
MGTTIVKSGCYEPVSWDKALDTIAENFLELREKYGAETLVFGAGTVRGNHAHINRFLHLFGSPNFRSPIDMSGGPVIMASAMICGLGILGPDIANTKCITLWGHNPEQSSPGLFNIAMKNARKAGAKLIVVDPRGIRAARQADHWLKLRPGTDAALALGMVNYVIEHDLFDKAFVENHTVGFKRLTEHVKPFSLARCAEITGIAAKTIEAATLTFASAESVALAPGMGSMCQQSNGFQIGRALTCLIAITGNLAVKGGTVNWQIPTGDRNVLGARLTMFVRTCPKRRPTNNWPGRNFRSGILFPSPCLPKRFGRPWSKAIPIRSKPQASSPATRCAPTEMPKWSKRR